MVALFIGLGECVMILEQKKIGPNITVNLLKTDKFKSNFVSVNYIQPLCAKNASYNALIPRVLKRGCAQYKDNEALAKRLEELYASDIFCKVSKCGEMQILSFSADMLDSSYAIDSTDISSEVISLLMQIITTPLIENGMFCEKYVSDEKQMLIHSIKSKINNKNKYALDRCKELMCSNEIYGISEIGTVEGVDAITNEALYSQYLDVISNSQVQIFLVGNFDLGSVINMFTPVVSKISEKEINYKGTEIVRHVDVVKTYVEDISAVQGKLSMGFRTGVCLRDNDYFAFPLFNELFGGSPISKLFMNVREKKSLCYYCSSRPDSVKGIMIVAAGIKNEDKQTAELEIMRQLDEMKAGNISEEEFACAKKSLKNAYAAIYDSPTALESWYLTRALNFNTDSPENMSQRLDEITVDDIVRLSKKVQLDTIYFMNGTGEGGEEGDANE